MNFLTKAYVKVTECKAQAMTEYALILSAVAVVAFVTYAALGSQIVALLGSVNADL